GGPKEIIEQCNNGLHVDVENPEAIATALKQIIADGTVWEKYSTNGIVASSERYSWKTFAEKYAILLDELYSSTSKQKTTYRNKSAYGKRLAKTPWFFITDIDGTLVDGKDVN